MKTFKPAAHVSYHVPFMGAAVIPHYGDRSPKMLEKMTQESVYFGLLDVLFMQGEIKTESVSFGADRYARNDADSMAKVMIFKYRG